MEAVLAVLWRAALLLLAIAVGAPAAALIYSRRQKHGRAVIGMEIAAITMNALILAITALAVARGVK